MSLRKPKHKVGVVPHPAYCPPAREPPPNTHFNGILKTDLEQIWLANESFPVGAISLSHSGTLEIRTDCKISFLIEGDFSFYLEGTIRHIEAPVTLKYSGSPSRNQQYANEFLTKKIDLGSSQLNWTTIIRAQSGDTVQLFCDTSCFVNGQLIIQKL